MRSRCKNVMYSLRLRFEEENEKIKSWRDVRYCIAGRGKEMENRQKQRNNGKRGFSSA